MPSSSDSSNSRGQKTGPERFLGVDHLSGDLRGRSIRGGAVTLTNQGLKFIITLGSTAILARILTPEDFGLIAMVLAIIGFIATFKDMGLAMATVQRVDINHGQVSTLFWINLGVSVVIMGITAFIAPVLAWFYNEPRVVNITVVLAGTIIFSGLTVQHQALLRRQMRFGAIAVIEIVALCISVTAAIIGALAGLGYWALVLMPIAREIVTTIGVWTMCGWRPGKPVRRAGVRRMLSFGGYLTGFNIVNYFARNLDKILVGRTAGAASLGLYNKAYQLVLLPIQQINIPMSSVAVPTLSRLQNQLDRYRAYYRRGVLLALTAGMPLIAFLFVRADKAVLTLLGPQWIDAVMIFRILAPAAFIGTTNVATGWVYVSMGMTRRQFSWGIFASLVTIGAFFIGLRWGAVGVAAAYSIVIAVLRIPGAMYCFKPTHLHLGDLGIAMWRPAIASILAGAALFFAGRLLTFDIPLLISLTLDFVVYLLFYMVIWVLLPHGGQSVFDLFQVVRELKRSPRDPGRDIGGGPEDI